MLALTFEELLGIFNYIPLGNWNIPVFGLILLIPSLILLGVLYHYSSRALKNRVSFRGESPNFYNGLRFFLRIGIIILALVLIFWFLQVASEYVLILTGIFVTAITFASMKSINNFIAGVYLSITHPFTIGDYVKIGDLEGIIIELNLNHIKMHHRDASTTLIPNLSFINSKIENYTLSTDWFKNHITELKNAIEINSEKMKKRANSQLSILNKNLKEELMEMESLVKEITAVQKTFILEKEEDERIRQELKEKRRKERAERKAEKIRERLESVMIVPEENNTDDEFNKEKAAERLKKRQDLEEKLRIIESEQENYSKTKGKPIKNLNFLKRSIYVEDDKIVRYRFTLLLPREPKRIGNILTQVCGEWTDEFEVTPRWNICGIGARIQYEFIILTPDPFDVILFYDEFVEDIYQAVYTK